MSVLPAQTIRYLCQVDVRSHGGVVLFQQKPLVSPFYEQSKQSGLTFGLGPAGYDIRIAQDVLLRSKHRTLASSVERVAIPHDIQAELKDKSTWIRAGLRLGNTVIDPGFEGYITIELFNDGDTMIGISNGDPIGQLVFHRLETPTEQPYIGKYQNQGNYPQEAIFDVDANDPKAQIARLQGR